ncbi:succinyl-CoA ligase subunit alpha [Microthyrium microscopicum]|uniref:Succinyl-CoA ligase subunit alpha n=1 Tax=Microthyrium microscopicum TaxID=703497 RepID=A0A6A6UJQ8_9PEZI|nr:succinyl-CoA ligase subunit alpha [Microthyrium microscopicum]
MVARFGSRIGRQVRHFQTSSSTKLGRYEDSIPNLLIGKDTRVIFQGITGRVSTSNAQASIAWGTNIVGGTKPGFDGRHEVLDIPVLPTVRKAVEELKPNATAVFVPADTAAAAIIEAIEAEVPLIVAVAEHIPLHDLLRVHEVLATQSKCRLVGANSPGIISAMGHCRIGFQPLASYSPGPVAVAAKSGTLSYDAVTSLTDVGIGQSLCIGIGGDVVAGTDMVDALKTFELDSETEAIILIGEIGGTSELEAADWIKEYRQRVSDPKPIAALVAGLYAVPRKVMGHAGAWAGPGEPTAEEKWKALENAGATMVDHTAKFGNVMKGLLASKGSFTGQKKATNQSMSFHTATRRPGLDLTKPESNKQQTRSFHLAPEQSTELLKEQDVTVSSLKPVRGAHTLMITVDRTARSPCILVAPNGSLTNIKRYSFPYTQGPSKQSIVFALKHLGEYESATDETKVEFTQLIQSLWTLFRAHEGVSLSLSLSIAPDFDPSEGNFIISNPQFVCDDAGFRSAKRHTPEIQDQHASLFAGQDRSKLDQSEMEAAEQGMVYIPVNLGSGPFVGTLVNGAGLALNTIDSLVARGISVTNFLDTGGKATGATIKSCMELILRDERVKVVFVNIFAGVLLCDKLAEGLLEAVDELAPKAPIVVRLRGTREIEAQKVMQAGRKGVYSERDFEKAVEKVKQLLAA